MLFSHLSRTAAAVVVAALAVLFAPAPAGAKILELGKSIAAPGEPDCPGTGEVDPATGEEDRCNAVTTVTGYMFNDEDGKDPFAVPRDGRVVAWTIGLSDPSAQEEAFFEATYGGPARAGISVVQQREKGSTLSEVTANSAVRNLSPYFGKRVQFPLVESLPVEKGQRVALTVPTWAPALVDSLSRKTSWRGSRIKGETTTTTDAEGNTVKTNGCTDYSTQSALLGVDSFAPFGCFYTTARLTYSVTIITEPRPARKPRRPRPDAEDARAASAGRDAGAPRVLGVTGGAESPVQ